MKTIRFYACAVVAALALVLTAAPATAGDGEWTTITPHDEVTGFSAARGAADVLYTISTTEGIHLSENRGETWTPRNSGLAITELTAIATAPSDPNRVVVAERGGRLQVSNNRGGSWSSSGSGSVSNVTAIVFKPGDDDVIVALDDGQNAVLRSTNGGATWTTHTAGLPASSGSGDQLTMVVVPLLPDTLYAGTADGVYQSEDGGVSWSAVTGEALPSGTVLELIPHPVESETVAGLFVVGDEIQFWRSNDAGAFWYRPGEDQIAKFRAQAVAVDMHDPSRLLVGGGNGVFGSVDAAHIWVDLNNGLEPDVSADTRTIEFVGFDPLQTLRYYAVSEGVLQIYDGLIATDLVVSATPDPARVDADGSTTIEFAVANITGEAATDIVFTFTAPAAFGITDWTISSMDCSHDGGTINCTRDRLIPSDTITGTVVAQGTGSEGLHTFTITAIAAEREATPDNNTLQFDVRIGDAPPDSGGGDSGGGGSGGGGSGGGDSGGGGSGGGGSGGGGGTPQEPRPPSGRSGGGSGGWLWLLGSAAVLAGRRHQITINRR